MNSLLRTRALLPALAPSRHAFASTSSFCTSAKALAPPTKGKGAASEMVGLLDGIIDSADYAEMGGQEEGELLFAW